MPASKEGSSRMSFSSWLFGRKKSKKDDRPGSEPFKPWKSWSKKSSSEPQDDSVMSQGSSSLDQEREQPPELLLAPENGANQLQQSLEHLSIQSTHVNECTYKDSIERVKSCGWYWGPISKTAAERLVASEPDGSFLVRDSSDDRHVFSLTFKLAGNTRHVRIEHDGSGFSFGGSPSVVASFHGATIVDFIEQAVESSRSGSHVFFDHRRPSVGPNRVQLLHPVSRFRRVHSLQHQCRFVILGLVSRDLLHLLPVPRSIQDYLNTPFYYSEIMHLPEEESANNANK